MAGAVRRQFLLRAVHTDMFIVHLPFIHPAWHLLEVYQAQCGRQITVGKWCASRCAVLAASAWLCCPPVGHQVASLVNTVGLSTSLAVLEGVEDVGGIANIGGVGEDTRSCKGPSSRGAAQLRVARALSVVQDRTYIAARQGKSQQGPSIDGQQCLAMPSPTS